MSNEDQIRIFQKKLLKYLHERNKSQTQVAEDLGIKVQTLNNWCTGVAYPRMGKIQALADYFHINKSDLIEDKNNLEESDEAMQIYNLISRLPHEKQIALRDYIRFLLSDS